MRVADCYLPLYSDCILVAIPWLIPRINYSQSCQNKTDVDPIYATALKSSIDETFSIASIMVRPA
jgi:hypothetical protein